MENKNMIYLIIGVVLLIVILIIVLVSTSSNNSNNSITKQTTNTTEHKTNKLCDWIYKKDIIIQLKLPEKYGFYTKRTVFPSYNVGFRFDSGQGIADLTRLARKQCDYKVGFDKSELEGKGKPMIIVAEKNNSIDFVYGNEPYVVNSKNSLPKEINLNITGEHTRSNHYVIFKK